MKKIIAFILLFTASSLMASSLEVNEKRYVSVDQISWSNITSSPYAFEAYVTLKQKPTTFATIVADWGAENTQKAWRFGFQGENNQLFLVLEVFNGARSFTYKSEVEYSEEKTHWAVALNRDYVRMFRNGEEFWKTESNVFPQETEGKIYFGSDNAGGHLVATLDNIRIWDSVRTPEEIKASFDKELSEGVGLAGSWHFSPGGTGVDSTGKHKVFKVHDSTPTHDEEEISEEELIRLALEGGMSLVGMQIYSSNLLMVWDPIAWLSELYDTRDYIKSSIQELDLVMCK